MKKFVALVVVLYAVLQGMSAVSLTASAKEAAANHAAQIERAVNNN